MQAHEYAFGSRDLLADKPFRTALQRAFPSTPTFALDCWFSPRDVRVEFIKGQPFKREGCWVIWQRVTEHFTAELGRGFSVNFPRHIWAPAYKLDGTYGLPTEPGAWTIEVLKASDRTRDCNANRADFLNEVQRQDVMKQFEAKKEELRLLEKDKLWKKVTQLRAEHFGNETMSGDQKAAWRRHHAELEKKDLEAAEKLSKQVQFYKG